jgi:acetyltransferase
MPDIGKIAFISQSGALCTAVLDYAQGKHIGFSKFVSLGNKTDVTEVDMLKYLADDPLTSVILMYLEEVRDGRSLIEIARQITSRGANSKPILAIKGGRTAAGAAAAQSHTGALAASDVVCDAVFRQAGIIRSKSIEEMFNTAQLLAYQPLPRGNRIAIVTNAGGPGVMATDAAIERGLTLPSLADSTTALLKKNLPAAANIKNPIDVIGDARDDRYAAAMDAVYDDEAVDQILVILTPQSMTNITKIASTVCDIHDRHRQAGKTLVCSFMGAKDVAPGIDILQNRGIPHYILPEWACESMQDAVRYREWLSRPQTEVTQFKVDFAKAAAVIDQATNGYLTEPQSLDVLAAYGFPVPEYQLAKTAEEAVAAADKIGYPVVLRIVSPKIIHKFDVKGVILDVTSPAQVRVAWSAMMDGVSEHVAPADIHGVLVRRMIPAGKEVILGVNRDLAFGHVVMLGLGGIYVEAFKDVTFRVVPIRAGDAGLMIDELRMGNVLKGLRGEKPSDLDAIRDAIGRLSQLAADFPGIAELDINPLIVHPTGQGAKVADVRIRLERS